MLIRPTVVLAAVLLPLSSWTVAACSCVGPATPLPIEVVGLRLPDGYAALRVNPSGQDEYGQVVFRGRLTDDTLFDRNDVEDSWSPRRLTFRVEEELWGQVPERVELWTGSDGASCGWSAAVGTVAVIFARFKTSDESPRFSTSICTRNTTEREEMRLFAEFLRGFRDSATADYQLRPRSKPTEVDRWDKLGGMSISYSLRDGNLDGPFAFRNRDAALIAEGAFDNGRRVGRWTHGYGRNWSQDRQRVLFADTYEGGELVARQPIPIDTMPLPYASIGKEPYGVTAGTILKRSCDGLGFRYYWATDSLRQQDLEYRPTPEARSTYETLEHLYGLSEVIYNTAAGFASRRPLDLSAETYASLRAKTLLNIENAANLFARYDGEEIAALTIRFERNGKTSSAPMWNLINGPLADAIYHTGQVVTLRRISGNPIASGVNVFRGTKN